MLIIWEGPDANCNNLKLRLFEKVSSCIQRLNPFFCHLELNESCKSWINSMCDSLWQFWLGSLFKIELYVYFEIFCCRKNINEATFCCPCKARIFCKDERYCISSPLYVTRHLARPVQAESPFKRAFPPEIFIIPEPIITAGAMGEIFPIYPPRNYGNVLAHWANFPRGFMEVVKWPLTLVPDTRASRRRRRCRWLRARYSRRDRCRRRRRSLFMQFRRL